MAVASVPIFISRHYSSINRITVTFLRHVPILAIRSGRLYKREHGPNNCFANLPDALWRGEAEMANEYTPRIGDWYQSVGSDDFEIVAIDEEEATLEIQYFDGSVEEIDFDSWYEMEIQPIEPPEDWSGSMDVEREDYGVDLELNAPNDRINPLDDLE